MAKKTFVLDTNILINSPNALSKFEDNDVIITEAVLEELDKFKKDKDERGMNARAVVRELENLRQKGNLINGVCINESKGILKVETNHRNINLPENWNLEKADHRILQICKALKDEEKDVRLITNDILLRIKADIINIKSEAFETEQSPDIKQQYTGRLEIYLKDKDFDSFYENGELLLDHTPLIEFNEHGEAIQLEKDIYPNEYVLMKNSMGNTALGKIDTQCRYIKKLNWLDYSPYGVTPRNVAQKFMIDALMSDTPLVILKGVAGSAKTFLSIAVGLERVIGTEEFRKVLITRPSVGLGGPEYDIGYLPGSEREKMDPYMRSCYDNLEILVDSNEKERYNDEDTLQSKVAFILDKGYIDFQAVSFLRGRSITKQYVVVEECQNISMTQAKAIVTRVGEGTKLILCGDPQQIDTPFLDSRNNGLSWISERMKGSKYCVQVSTSSNECVRSKLAEDAINRLS